MTKQTTDCAAFLTQLREKNAEFYGDPRGRGVLRDLQQTFPHPWLYIAELLQNAIDERAGRIRLLVDGDTFVFEHDGSPFKEGDVEALAMRGVSHKGAGTVGFMGLGFKAVFCSFQHVAISSGAWRFAFKVAAREMTDFHDQQRDWLGAVLPIHEPAIDPPSKGMTCRFVLSERMRGLDSIEHDIRQVLGAELALLPLLARRGVKELEWNGELWRISCKEHRTDISGVVRVSIQALSSSSTKIYRWVMFSAAYRPSREAVGRYLQHRQLTDDKARRTEANRKRHVEVFCGLDDSGDPDPPASGQAFALLPVGVSFCLGLHVQADWLLVTSRQQLMDSRGNAWHEEIVAQLPRLIRSFFLWVARPDAPRGPAWRKAFAALPQVHPASASSADPLQHESFRTALRQALQDAAFLPVLRAAGFVFLTPAEGRLAPPPIRRLIDDSSIRPWEVIGPKVVSPTLLGERAHASLAGLGLLSELAPADLEAFWQPGVLDAWLEHAGDDRLSWLVRLHGPLAQLGSTSQAWSHARLKCLPTESGDWIESAAATRFPGEWNAVPDAIKAELRSYVGEDHRLVSWPFDSYVQGRSLPSLLDSVPRLALETLVKRWWTDMPEIAAEDRIRAAVDFTCWVRSKQRQRGDLVHKVVCGDAAGEQKIVPLEHAVLADPYASSTRRRFCPGLPVVSRHYLDADRASSAQDWVSFFDGRKPSLQGAFRLERVRKELTAGALRTLCGSDFTVPELRTTPVQSCEWDGTPFSQWRYLLLDARLPVNARAVLGSPTPQSTRELLMWMAERPNEYRQYGSVAVASVRKNRTSPEAIDLPHSAVVPTWRRELSNHRWLYARDGSGPFRPAEILAEPDAARPAVPVVADMPVEVRAALEHSGVTFGAEVRAALAIERLRARAESAPPEELVDLLRQTLQEWDAGPEDLRPHVEELPLLLLPPGESTPDGRTRIGRRRLVRRLDARVTNLGGWAISIDRWPDGSAARDLARLLDEIWPVPETTSADQAIDFLSWVWRQVPEASLVRQVLPRAYRLVREQFSMVSVRWQTVCKNAKVFCDNRKWVGVAGEARPYFDDLALGEFKAYLKDVPLATPGHLGEAYDHQLATADMLDLGRLSARFAIRRETEAVSSAPEGWTHRFESVQDYVGDRMARSDAAEDIAGELGAGVRLALQRCESIRLTFLDAGVPVGVRERQAARFANDICVVGDPFEFASELCQAFFDSWGVLRRHDATDIAMDATSLLTLLDLGPRFEAQLTRLRARHGLDVLSATAETGGATEQSTTEVAPTPSVTSEGTLPRPEGESASEAGDPDLPSPAAPHKRRPEVSSKASGAPTGGGSFTHDDREAFVKAAQKRLEDAQRQVESLLACGLPAPTPEEDKNDAHVDREFGSDREFRDSVIAYERAAGRFPDEKGADQPGHDLDSYTHPPEHPERKLVRRIEVKGRGVPWVGNQVVLMSSRQYDDARHRRVDGAIATAEEFDYWLYVVETTSSGHRVLPIRNPCRRAKKFELTATTWGYAVETEPPRSDK
jgi:hypothetical protein